MNIEFVPSELSNGLIGGSDYGQARVVARSPTHVLFHSLGAHIWTRGTESWHGRVSLTRNRPTLKLYDSEIIRAKVDELFGAGIGEAVQKAYRNKQTVLVDGGGTKLYEPGHVLRKRHAEQYAAATINWEADLSTEVPKCLQCEKPLKPKFTVHNLGPDLKDNHPRTVEDCQRLSNYRVVAIHDYGLGKHEGYVKSFDTWDGESTFDPHFCGDTCAAKYGRRAATEGIKLEPNIQPERIDWQHNQVKLFPEPRREFFTTPDGKKIEV